ncbi:MAG: family 2 glycosyl transferase [Candidatus Omnitrophica bacterium]|nr:family 2 glycosyl transferase [Candidatus Omnitrophota bacterium]
MFSLVCVYDNEKVLADYLLKSLKEQTAQFELIKIDNAKGEFKSVARAFNDGAKRARGEYIMFVHQDVDLRSKTWLEDAEKILGSIPDLGIAGVAGARRKTNGAGLETISNIEYGTPAKNAGNTTIAEPTKVQTVDECLTIIPRSVFGMQQFDEKVCDSLHLFAVDYCLSILRQRLNVYVIPAYVYHRSSGKSKKGSLPKAYFVSLGKLIRKHKKDYRYIYTTCGLWRSGHPLFLQRVIYPRMIKFGFRSLWRKSGLKRLCSRTE